MHEAVIKLLQRSHPDFFDPFSQGQDHVCRSSRLPRMGALTSANTSSCGLRSMQETSSRQPLRTPMGSSLTPKRELKQTIADALAKQHAEMKAVGGKSSHVMPPSPVELKRVDELGEIFEQLDALGDILPASMESWQMPSFVVLGAESSGKSTLLERVSMFSMFPRADGSCPPQGTRHCCTPLLLS